jgi:hypothetical protein
MVVAMSHLAIGSQRPVLVGWINVGEFRDTRIREVPRIAWPTLFMKGYSLAAREVPEFGRICIKLPWLRAY